MTAMSLFVVLAEAGSSQTSTALLIVLGFMFGPLLLIELMGMRYIPNNCVGVVEKLWSPKGSVQEGRIIALDGEAGFQSEVLRGGFHFGMWRWQYRIHKVPLVTVPQGEIGYVYSRDGEPLAPSQTLGRVVDCNNFQDASLFLTGNAEANILRGERGRQRSILREGVYAINLAQFIVITAHRVFQVSNMQGTRLQESQSFAQWQAELNDIDGFHPVLIGEPLEANDPIHPEQKIEVDSIGIVTVHDGPSLQAGEIIAPAVGIERDDVNFHNNFQDPEAFLRAGGRRGRQYVPLTDGTYFINRWFATIEQLPKTVVPIGYVGVVVSYYGKVGNDVSGQSFRHGERVAIGERGVWQMPLGPGKYPFNTYAGNIILVPTTNFVLHWITGKSETHRYDDSLKSIDLVTKDAYEPLLPLSVVVHIDYQKAPSVIQRFGDVKKLITQTLDPLLSAYFRDVAHKKTMLQLLQERDEIQHEAREALREKFCQFDIEAVAVLIGKPDTSEKGGKIETLLDQLRQRQLAMEQLETFDRQREAAERQKSLNEAQASANMQTQLTNSRVQAQIAEASGEAELAKARKSAQQMVVMADAELSRARKNAEQLVVTAEAESQQLVLAGQGEAKRVMQTGLAEAAVLLRKIHSYGDPRLYALNLVAERLAESTQPLVPERIFISGSQDGTNGHGNLQGGIVGTLLSLLVAEKSGFQLNESSETAELKILADKMTREAADYIVGSLKDGEKKLPQAT